ncbi:alpha/beta fold hydrolase [Miltoncostaea oceani]|uniref:alpha/beta fold hydrolase n=1 Tax=Miltoncostaea oceani TaxID=2843216 RepID=UPI001C3DF7EE|nr:alpha/beta fold hydrolase [Miltoncostaea oceani]
MVTPFTPAHRGGAGTPLVLLHGFTDTWRTWELVLPALERHHDVLAPTLAGHAGGPPLPDRVTGATLADAVERAMDAAGMDRAHIAGNSLGGYVALQLAARGRATSVVALAPAGGWDPGAPWVAGMLDGFTATQEALRHAAPRAGDLVATPEGRRRATAATTVAYAHIPAELLAHQILGVVACTGLAPLLDVARREGYRVDAAAITCPVRIVWGTEDALLPWPGAAERMRRDWLPHADWVVMDGVGHCPQLDVPVEAAALILGGTTDPPRGHPPRGRP